MQGKEKWIKRSEFQKFLSSIQGLPNRVLRPGIPTIEAFALHLINQKNDLYFLDILVLMRPFLTLTSESFLSFLL